MHLANINLIQHLVRCPWQSLKFPPFHFSPKLPRLRHDDAHLPVDLAEADAAHEGAVRGEVVHHVRHVVVRCVGVLTPLLRIQGWMVGIPAQIS